MAAGRLWPGRDVLEDPPKTFPNLASQNRACRHQPTSYLWLACIFLSHSGSATPRRVPVRSAGVRLCRWSLSLFLLFLFAPSLTAQAIRLHVDLTDAPRNIYH